MPKVTKLWWNLFFLFSLRHPLQNKVSGDSFRGTCSLGCRLIKYGKWKLCDKSVLSYTQLGKILQRDDRKIAKRVNKQERNTSALSVRLSINKGISQSFQYLVWKKIVLSFLGFLGFGILALGFFVFFYVIYYFSGPWFLLSKMDKGHGFFY